ncbi:hypothetical protein SARC_12969, partial [Sphaeroforma arctica JP610]
MHLMVHPTWVLNSASYALEDHLQLLIPKEQHKYNMELARLTTAFLTQQSHRPLTAIKSHYARMDPEIE